MVGQSVGWQGRMQTTSGANPATCNQHGGGNNDSDNLRAVCLVRAMAEYPSDNDLIEVGDEVDGRCGWLMDVVERWLVGGWIVCE